AKPVSRARTNAFDVSVPDVLRACGQLDVALGVTVEQAQLHAGGRRREDGGVRALAVPGRPERLGATRGDVFARARGTPNGLSAAPLWAADPEWHLGPALRLRHRLSRDPSVTVALTSSSPRRTRTSTVSPGFWARSASVMPCRSATSCSPIASTMSPACRPPRSAGDPAVTPPSFTPVSTGVKSGTVPSQAP